MVAERRHRQGYRVGFSLSCSSGLSCTDLLLCSKGSWCFPARGLSSDCVHHSHNDWVLRPGIGTAVKNRLAVKETQETQVWPLDQEDPLEEEMASHSSILAWRTPGTLQSMDSRRVRHEWAHTSTVSTWLIVEIRDLSLVPYELNPVCKWILLGPNICFI